MTALKNQRVEEIDTLKAIGIICMVLGHSGAPFTRFVFLFHMALFFIASGYTYKQESSDSLAALGKTLLKKIKRLWLPFFFWSTFFTLLNNFLIRVNIFTDNPELLTYTSSIKIMNHSSLAYYMSPKETLASIAGHGLFIFTNKLTGSLWFLRSLFGISLAYAALDWLFKKTLHRDTIVMQAVVSIILLVLGTLCGHRESGLLNIMGNLASCYHLYFLGILLKRYRHIYADWHAKQHLLALTLSLCMLLLLYFFGSFEIGLGTNRHPYPVLFLTTTMSGWVFCYSCAYFLNRSFLKQPMVFIGKRTMCILIFHVLAFKIVNAIVIRVYDLPAFCLAARPHLYGDVGLWWIAFTIVGTACPLLLYQPYEQFKKLIERKR